MPDRGGLLRGAIGSGRRPARRCAGGTQSRAGPGLSTQRLRRGLSGIEPAYRMPVFVYVRRVDGPSPRSVLVGARPSCRRGGVGGQRLCADRGGDLLPYQRDLAVVGIEPVPDRIGRCAYLLPLARSDGECTKLPCVLRGRRTGRGAAGGWRRSRGAGYRSLPEQQRRRWRHSAPREDDPCRWRGCACRSGIDCDRAGSASADRSGRSCPSGQRGATEHGCRWRDDRRGKRPDQTRGVRFMPEPARPRGPRHRAWHPRQASASRSAPTLPAGDNASCTPSARTPSPNSRDRHTAGRRRARG